jgi:large subunit ribosomal protein L11
MFMAKQTIEALVDGGKASAGPPLGPALGPLGVNIGEVINAINEKTKDMAGMKVPVKVIIDTETKEFGIELGLKKGSEEPGKKRVGDLTHEQAKKIAKIKFNSDDDASLRQVEGSARSMGITVGKGEVTEEEIKAYEEAKAAEEAEKAAAVPEGKEAPAEAPEEAEKEAEGKPEKKEEKKEE